MSSSKSTVNSNTKMPKKSAPANDSPSTSTAPPSSTAAPRSRKAPAKTEVTVPVVSQTTTPAAESSVVAATPDTRSASDILGQLQEQIRSLSSDISSRLRSAVHDAQEAVKAMKRDARSSKQRRKVDPSTLSPEARAAWEARRANNAFLKMRPISDELSSFMGLPAKSQRSQTDVTKFVANYVKTHNCFDPNMKRRILPDTKLSKLLRVKDGQEVTYLNLQTYLKVHFLKPAVTA
jgi:chromatin remodeling complex protein RSC6